MSCTLEEWKELILAEHPTAQFTVEDGSGKTYGDIGDWTAHTGPDMQADVVGCCSPDNGFSWYLRGVEVIEC